MVKKQFPQGTRIELVSMNDPYSPVPSGMRGTVDCVDDIGTIFPTWDDGRSLGLVYGEDRFRKLTPEELDKLKEAVTGQASDGLGEGWEQRPIQVGGGELYVHLWQGDGWSIMTEQDRFPKQQQEQGGMTFG